jgi:hypothetical protein
MLLKFFEALCDLIETAEANPSTDYLEFLCECEARCETDLAHESGP